MPTRDAVVCNRQDLARLRRKALAAQGLSRKDVFGRGTNAVQKAIEHIGYVQIDTISVVERAHHHVLHSRVSNYQPKMLDRLIKKRSVFEYWAHAAAFLPMSSYRYTLPYKAQVKAGKQHWFKDTDPRLMKSLMDRIRQDGQLRSRDIEEPKKQGGWWEWKPAKRALEHLYFQGDLMVSERHGFQKAYDLPERVLPTDVDTTMPSYTEYADYLLSQQMNCHGFASLKGVTYLRRDADLRKATKQLIDDKVAEGELIWLQTPKGEKYVTRAETLDQTTPRLSDRMVILSPFDNVLIQRERVMDLFDFDYQIECYVPEAKRKFGYFCLPLLQRDEFVGLIDAKVHRNQQRLAIQSLHLLKEEVEPQEFASQLASALQSFALFQGAQHITIEQIEPRKNPAKLKGVINDELSNLGF